MSEEETRSCVGKVFEVVVKGIPLKVSGIEAKTSGGAPIAGDKKIAD